MRNAFQPKFFLTTGDWTARLWNEDLRVPICTSPYAAAALTAARWSPTRRAPPKDKIFAEMTLLEACTFDDEMRRSLVNTFRE